MRVGASGKAKGTSEGFVVNGSIANRRSERNTEGIARGEGGRAWRSERLTEWERAAMAKIKGRVEDLGMWAREGNEGIGSA
jgi:hypothetical protein